MASDLATDATGVQLTLTAFLVGVAAGQLVFVMLATSVVALVAYGIARSARPRAA